MEKILPVPENEVARIEKLRYYNILDSASEDMFDDLTKLAALILEVPICALSLIDEHRQWFKSIVGLDSSETSREVSFCQYTIMQKDILEVPDATKDERFKDNPLVTGNPAIRFYSGAPLQDEDGVTIGSFCVIDSKPRKLSASQQQLLQLISNTAMKLIQLRREKMEVEKLTIIKDEFISNMSHEIRTPLNAIIGFNDLLSKTSLNKEQTNFLNTVSVATHNLKNIINDVLDVSKLEGNKIQLENRPFSITALVQHIIKLQSPSAKLKNLRLLSSLDHDLPNYVYGDETRLTQILNNLVSNALKFTEDGYVEVRAMVSSKQSESTTILLEVKDTGIGIPQEKKQQIFERFEQAEISTSRLYGGTGLGLNIVEKLVTLFGGEVKLESEEGKGSLFSFELEFKDCTAYEPQKVTKKVESNGHIFKGYKILLVEDNFHNQLLAKSYFKRWGAEITIAENGAVALDILLKSNFDIILMDLQMPKMDGFVATNKIRKELKLNIPIIGCSANSEASELKKCFDSGMNDFISKPYSEDGLIQTTLKHLNKTILDSDIQPDLVNDFDDSSIVISYLKTSYGEEMFCQSQKYFLTRTPDDINEIKSAIVEKDMLFLKNKAHFIAGTLGVLNFFKGCKIAKELEATAKMGQVSKSLLLAKKLIGHLNNAMKCFEQETAA